MITSRCQLCLLLAASFLFSFEDAARAQTPTLSVNATFSQHPINPNIYGIANYGLSAEFAKEIQVPNIRWGGDATTRYNWTVDSSNAGFDWYFMGGSGESSPVAGASPDLMINTYKPAGAGALITIPIIPYVNSTAAWTCSFPTSIYGAQESTNPYVHPDGDEDCGNSLSSSGAQLLDTNILANHVPNTTTLQQGWLQHLVSTFGTAANGGVPFYQLDNEPGGWANTHRDIEPTEPPYSTIVSLGQQYAAAVKQVDPTAMVLGPSDFTLGGWIGTPSEQNSLFAGQYYLQQMALYNQTTGSRVLDYFDEHYYPQFSSPATQLASTRTLWDPTYNGGTWVEQWYFYGPMQLIPRFHQWIGEYYPGTKLAFSEYSIDSGNKLITDALAEADVLGIFGQQEVDFANMWSAPASTDPIAYAFRLFRNYDGQGSQFGGTSVSAVSSIPGNLSIYAAERASDGALTIIVINKTTTAIQTNITIANFLPAGAAAIYSYSGANLAQITAQGTAPVVAGDISYNFPAYSATVFVLQASKPSTLTAPVPGSTLAGNNVAFTWTAATGAKEYEFWVGSEGPGTGNIHYPGLTTGTTETVTGLPANGEKLYVRLWSKIEGAWQYNDYTYTSEKAPGVLTMPSPGSTLANTSVAFTWTAGTGAAEYELWVGTEGAGSNNLNYPGLTTGTSETVSGLPANGGGTLFVRLYSKIDGVWLYNDYTYRAE